MCNSHLPKAVDYFEHTLDTLDDRHLRTLIAECANWHADQMAMLKQINTPPARTEWKTLVSSEIEKVTYIHRRLVEVQTSRTNSLA